MFLSHLSQDEIWLHELKSRFQTLSPESPHNEQPPQQIQDKPDVFQAEIPERRVAYDEALKALQKEFAQTLL